MLVFRLALYLRMFLCQDYMKKILAAFILLFSSSVFAETVNFCSHERAELSEKNGTGYYWDILRAVYKIEGAEITHDSAPFLRCLIFVDKKRSDGSVAAFKTPERTKEFFYPQSRLHYSSYGIATLKQTSFNQIEGLKGHVGLTRGYDFSAWLSSDLNIHLVKDTIQGIKMLKRKRFNYHADDIQDIKLAIRKMGERLDDYVMTTFYTKDLYVVFTKDASGQKLAAMFDSGIRKIAENGTLETLVKKYGLTHSILDDFKIH